MMREKSNVRWNYYCGSVRWAETNFEHFDTHDKGKKRDREEKRERHVYMDGTVSCSRIYQY